MSLYCFILRIIHIPQASGSIGKANKGKSQREKDEELKAKRRENEANRYSDPGYYTKQVYDKGATCQGRNNKW
jgi:hypothetical protein